MPVGFSSCPQNLPFINGRRRIVVSLVGNVPCLTDSLLLDKQGTRHPSRPKGRRCKSLSHVHSGNKNPPPDLHPALDKSCLEGDSLRMLRRRGLPDFRFGGLFLWSCSLFGLIGYANTHSHNSYLSLPVSLVVQVPVQGAAIPSQSDQQSLLPNLAVPSHSA